MGKLQNRDLPCPSALGVGVVVELVDDDEPDVGGRPGAQCNVRQDLLRATNDRSVRVYRGVTGDHADIVRTKFSAERKELLRHQCLDRSGVVAPLAACHCSEVASHADEGLSGPGRGGEDNVAARQQLEDRFFLRWIQLETNRRAEIDERVDQFVRI